MRAKRAKQPEQVKEDNRRYVLKVFYNLTPEDVQVIRAYQAEDPDFKLLLNTPTSRNAESVEHRHKDGLIRGVMHGLTNKAYGLLEALHPHNTAEVLRALAKFHEYPPAVSALGEPVYGLLGKAKHKKKMCYGPSGTPEPAARKNAKPKMSLVQATNR